MTIDWQEITNDVLLTSGLQETIQYPTGTAGGTISAIVHRGGLNTLSEKAKGNDALSMYEVEIDVSSSGIANPKENETLVGVKRHPGSSTYTVMTVRKIIRSDGAFKLGLDP